MRLVSGIIERDGELGAAGRWGTAAAPSARASRTAATGRTTLVDMFRSFFAVGGLSEADSARFAYTSSASETPPTALGSS